MISVIIQLKRESILVEFYWYMQFKGPCNHLGHIHGPKLAANESIKVVCLSRFGNPQTYMMKMEVIYESLVVPGKDGRIFLHSLLSIHISKTTIPGKDFLLQFNNKSLRKQCDLWFKRSTYFSTAY